MSRHPVVLIVDDDPDVVRSLQDLLEWALPVRAITAMSAGEAWQVLEDMERSRGPHVDLVLCDYRMPRLDGIAFLDRVRRCDPHPHMVLLTGWPELPAGIEVPVLQKAAGPEELVDAVAAILHARRLPAARRSVRPWREAPIAPPAREASS